MDEQKLNEFVGKVVNDSAAGSLAVLSWVGDQLGIFKAMAGAGPLDSQALAGRTGLSERYLREWLGGMAAAGYVTYEGGTFLLPDEHAMVLADEEGPAFLGGLVQMGGAFGRMGPRLAEAFKNGKGIAQSEYPPDAFECMERASAPAYRHQLAQRWIPAVPKLHASLERGGTVLDVGCGGGKACIAIARAFPKTRVFGFDKHELSVERARNNAREAGVDDRVAFKVVDCTELPRGEFDLVLACDVVHDAGNPVGLLSSMRNALTRDGVCLVQELNVSGHVHENIHPLGRFIYSSSCLYCLSVSLAEGGPGIGACMGEETLRDLATQAGFGKIARVAIEDPFFALYELGR